MNAHFKIGQEIARQRSLPEIVSEYEMKAQAIADALRACGKAHNDLQMTATVAGVYGNTHLKFDLPCERTLHEHLLKSAWLHVYAGLDIDRISSPTDKNLWKQKLEKLPPFTLDNIRELFGKYLLDPRGNMLRGLAEVFCGLDPAFKSHDNMKIGVKGLPKRIIMSGFGNYSSSGRDKLETILNALAAYQQKPLVDRVELNAILDNEDALLKAGKLTKYDKTEIHHPARGVRLRRFENGNGHLFFEPDTLRDVNKALAEFYGEVLPDTPDENPVKAKSTAVSKDLQYYPTPQKVIDLVLDHVYHLEGQRVLEPSCGDGRFMDTLRKRKADVFGIEVDAGRVAICRAKGHAVLHANFLETASNPIYDRVIMNPPFYGTHWAKHVRHAYEFLKPDGFLTAILPVTAKDSGLIDDLVGKDTYGERWRDLPVGSFSESGTNINTVAVTIHKPKEK
jgi:SAM-dependent methyltransferase